MKTTFLLLSAVVLLFLSCKKNNETNTNCAPVTACPQVLCLFFSSSFKFTITDKTTGSDLIFGSTPTLTPADVKLFIKSNASYTAVTVITDSSQRTLNTLFARDTMALQIKNEPLKTIIVKTFCAKDCCGVTATEIKYDGNLLFADDKDVINIKR